MAFLSLVRHDVRERDARVIVDGEEDVLLADVASAPAVIASDAVADVLEASELLDVDSQQLAWRFALIASDSFLLRPQIAQRGHAGSTQHPADRRFRGRVNTRSNVLNFHT